MFGDKDVVTLELNNHYYKESSKVIEELDLDFETFINLLLKKIAEEGTVLLEEEVIKDYKENKQLRAKNYLLNELEKGKNSFEEYKIEGFEVLMFLGVFDG